MSFVTRLFANRMSSRDGQPIHTDRPCANCGYNLRGLTSGGRCPECGTPIFRRTTRAIDFCDLPPGTIRKFSLGFYFAAATLTGMFVMLVGGYRLGWGPEMYAAAVTALSFVWFAAVWLMTTPLDVPYDQRYGAPWELKARTWARWLQLGWFAHMAVAWVHVATLPGPGAMLNILRAGYVVSELAGVAGIVLLCILLASFASWVRDDFAERCFNFTAYGMPTLSIILFVVLPMMGAVAMLVMFLSVFLVLIWVGSILAFPVGLWSLARSLSWAVRHSKDRIGRATEIADSLAPEPAPGAGDAPKASDEPIPLDDHTQPHEITYSMSQATPDAAKSASAMRRDRYDHERGDARGHGEAPQPDIF
jgi:hypothetical protein